MKRKMYLLACLSTLLALQGCVLVVGNDTDDGPYWTEERHSENGIRHDGDSLSEDVARVLGSDADLVAEDIRVSSEDGVVVLRGRVGSVDLLQRALDGARDVKGVERVISRLSVEAG